MINQKFIISNNLDFCLENLKLTDESISKMVSNGEFFINGDLYLSEEKLKEIIKLSKGLLERLGKFKEVKTKINEI